MSLGKKNISIKKLFFVSSKINKNGHALLAKSDLYAAKICIKKIYWMNAYKYTFFLLCFINKLQFHFLVNKFSIQRTILKYVCKYVKVNINALNYMYIIFSTDIY